jgi:hypothetical protein
MEQCHNCGLGYLNCNKNYTNIPLQMYHVITMTTPLLQQPEFTGLFQVSNVPDNQEEWPF